MKITLSKIKKHNPCPDGWEKILAAQGPDLDREWELVEAFKSNDLDDVLWALRCLPEYNALWRKYAVWCAKQVEHLLTDQRSWAAAVASACDAEWTAASAAAWAVAVASACDAEWTAASAAAWAVSVASACDGAWDAWAAAIPAAKAAARAAQKEKLIQILTAGEWVEEDGR
jgi:hypothetical protein